VDSHNELNERLLERLLSCQDKLDGYEDELGTWTDSLEELSIIENAFELDKSNKLQGNTILDIGTDCVKPLYIALKFEPCKIIGVSDDLPDFSSDLELQSKLFAKTKISFYDCNFFNKETLKKIRKEEEIEKFDIVLLSKTLHHLRTGECCIAETRDQKHECRKDEKCCINRFEEQKIFDKLLSFGKRVIVYEGFWPHEDDDDKVRGRGGYFTIEEWRRIFAHLSENYEVEFIDPLRCHLGKKESEKIITKLRQVDCICFYIEAR